MLIEYPQRNLQTVKTPSPLNRKGLLAAVVFSCIALPCVAQNIYKCEGKGGAVYTDHSCPGHHGKVIHQANDSDVIDHYLNLGQTDLAKRYAKTHRLDALYVGRVEVYEQQQSAERQRQATAALAAEQNEKQVKQQALADQRVKQVKLQAENDALREQNDRYHDEQTRPETDYANSGYLIDSSRRHGRYQPPRRHHDHGHKRPSELNRQPVYHPCTQLAGERTIC